MGSCFIQRFYDRNWLPEKYLINEISKFRSAIEACVLLDIWFVSSTTSPRLRGTGDRVKEQSHDNATWQSEAPKLDWQCLKPFLITLVNYIRSKKGESVLVTAPLFEVIYSKKRFAKHWACLLIPPERRTNGLYPQVVSGDNYRACNSHADKADRSRTGGPWVHVCRASPCFNHPATASVIVENMQSIYRL
jgi:hypothetical protein